MSDRRHNRLSAAFAQITTVIVIAQGIGCGAQARAETSMPANSAASQTNPAYWAPRPLGHTLDTPSGIHEVRPSPAIPLSGMEEVHLDVQEQPKAPQTAVEGQVWVQRIQIQGGTFLPETLCNQWVQPYEGHFQSLSSLQPLIAIITDFYRKQGYLTTEVYIPPQTMADGVLHIQVQEGRIGRISLEGNRYYSARVINRYFNPKPGSMLNFHHLEQALNSLNRFETGLKVKASLSAGAQAGQTNVRIRLAERQPWQITPTWDNQGRYFIGLYRAGVEVRNNSLLHLGDQLSLRYLGAQGTQVGLASYTLPLNRFGTEFSTQYAFSRVDVKLPVENPPSIIGRSYNAALLLSQPLGHERHWHLDVGLNWQRTENFFEGIQTEQTDVRAIQAGLTLDRFDRWGRTFNRLQSTVGFKGLGGNTSFWKLENYTSRLLVLPKNNLLILRSYAQWTPDALPPIQQFQLGGAYSVRGFTEGALIGDRGYNLGVEYRFPFPGLARMSPWLSQRVQGSFFYDFGQVWKDSSNPFYNARTATLAKTTLLQSAGFGVRAHFNRYLQGFVDVGFGLGDRRAIEPQGRQPTARVHFGVRTDLLPNDYKVRASGLSPKALPKLARQSAFTVR